MPTVVHLAKAVTGGATAGESCCLACVAAQEASGRPHCMIQVARLDGLFMVWSSSTDLFVLWE